MRGDNAGNTPRRAPETPTDRGAPSPPPEVGVGERKRLDRHERVLARLECSNEEKVGRPVAGRPIWGESVVDAVGDDDDLVLFDVVLLDQILLRSAGDGNDAIGAPHGAWHHRPEEEAVAGSHQLWVALEREIVDRHNGR